MQTVSIGEGLEEMDLKWKKEYKTTLVSFNFAVLRYPGRVHGPCSGRSPGPFG